MTDIDPIAFSENFVPPRYRQVSVQPYEGVMTVEAITAHLLGKEAYRRTRYVVLEQPSAWAVAIVGRDNDEALFSPITDVTMLTLPDTCRLAEDDTVDTANPTALAAKARALGMRAEVTLIVRGQDGHVGRPQRLEPFPARARLERGLHHRIVSPEPGAVSALGARPGDLLLRKLGGHLLHQGHVVGRRHHVDPYPVPTLEEARDHALRQSELERGAGLLGASPMHGELYEGALEQARVHGADATLALAHQETRQNSRGRQVHGAPAR